MVDVTGKPVTARRAVARCLVRATPDALRRLPGDENDPIGTARVAGVQAAKRTYQLIPLCHPLLVDDLRVDVTPVDGGLAVEALATIEGRTGVEMEALTACAAAGLSLVMSLLPHDPRASIGELTLWHKSGGRSGTWERR